MVMVGWRVVVAHRYGRLRDGEKWHPFFYQSVWLLLLCVKSVVTALGVTGTSVGQDPATYGGECTRYRFHHEPHTRHPQ